MSDILTDFTALNFMEWPVPMWTGLGKPARSNSKSSAWLIQHLLNAEQTDRALRSISYQMHAAKFLIHRDLASFNFDEANGGSATDQRTGQHEPP